MSIAEVKEIVERTEFAYFSYRKDMLQRLTDEISKYKFSSVMTHDLVDEFMLFIRKNVKFCHDYYDSYCGYESEFDEYLVIKNTAYAAVFHKDATSDGLVQLFEILCNMHGLETITLLSRFSNSESEILHYVAAVEISGTYLVYDPTRNTTWQSENANVIKCYYIPKEYAQNRLCNEGTGMKYSDLKGILKEFKI